MIKTMKLINKKEDKINNKTIYELEMEYNGQKTPDRKSVIEEASKELRLEAKNLIVKKIKNIYGKSASKVEIHAYKSPDDLQKIAPKHLAKRVAFKEEKKEEVTA